MHIIFFIHMHIQCDVWLIDWNFVDGAGSGSTCNFVDGPGSDSISSTPDIALKIKKSNIWFDFRYYKVSLLVECYVLKPITFHIIYNIKYIDFVLTVKIVLSTNSSIYSKSIIYCNRKGKIWPTRPGFEPGTSKILIRCSATWAIWPSVIEPIWLSQYILYRIIDFIA